jgi:hydroxybutyrate-dimer hydrolase
MLFGAGNGIPPTNGIELVYNDAVGGAVVHRDADGDFALLGAQRLRSLWTSPGAQADALRGGVDEVRLTGNLRGKPAIIVHGRSDAVVPVNHSSRPYFGMNKIAEGEASRLSYIEVENAQHFDTFLRPVDSQWTFHQHFLPLHYYHLQAIDLMWEHLHSGKPLPPSQVVRPKPRGPLAPPLDVATHLSPIVDRPAKGDAIHFDAVSTTVHVPD